LPDQASLGTQIGALSNSQRREHCWTLGYIVALHAVVEIPPPDLGRCGRIGVGRWKTTDFHRAVTQVSSYLLDAVGRGIV
jgi:hypothetical protein